MFSIMLCLYIVVVFCVMLCFLRCSCISVMLLCLDPQGHHTTVAIYQRLMLEKKKKISDDMNCTSDDLQTTQEAKNVPKS